MKENEDKFLYSIDQMRVQRHDFMNYLQVIYGYLQIGKPQEAINYIKGINSKMNGIGSIFNLNNPELALILQEFFTNCSKNGIEIDVYTELEYISCEIFSKNINRIRKVFANALKGMTEAHINYSGSSVKLYMNICDSSDEIIFIIGKSNDVIDLIEENKYNGSVELLYHDAELNSKINIYKNNNFFDALNIRLKKN